MTAWLKSWLIPKMEAKQSRERVRKALMPRERHKQLHCGIVTAMRAFSNRVAVADAVGAAAMAITEFSVVA